jgi:hypothetical protein
MASLLYFLPGTPPDEAAVYTAVAATAIPASLRAERRLEWRHTDAGPEGEGTVVRRKLPGHPRRMGYYPDDGQVWEAVTVAASGPLAEHRVWIGHESTAPPTPADLAAEEMVAGHAVRLADGAEWAIPLARVFPQGTALPESLRLAPDGKLVKGVLPRFAEFCARVERYWDIYVATLDAVAGGLAAPEWDDADAWRLAVEALSLNYHLGPVEVSHLGLVNTSNLAAVIGALFDRPTVEAVFVQLANQQKKNEPASTAAG